MSDAAIVRISAPAAPPVVKVFSVEGRVIQVRDSSVLVTPDEIGAYSKSEVDNLFQGINLQTEELAFQFPTPALTWAIPHKLGRLRPTIKIVDTAGDEILTDIKPQDANTAIATFAAPTAGIAYVN